MKNILIILVLMLTVPAVYAQSSKKQKKAEERAIQKENTKNLLESKHYSFDAKSANPMNGRTVHLDARYSVSIKNDTIDSFLPYYGRAYNVAYGGGSGMTFTQAIESYSFEETKKGFLVKLKVKNGNDNLDFIYNISDNGSTTLNVNSTNRQSISYHGNMSETKEK